MTDAHDSAVDGQQSRRIEWRVRLANGLLAVAGGMSVNLVSTDVGYRGTAVAFAVAGILLATSWIRRLPPMAPLTRYAIRILLCASLTSAVASSISPRAFAPTLIVGAALMTLCAVLIPNRVMVALNLLASAATIGMGVATVVEGIRAPTNTPQGAGIAIAGLGLAIVSFGVARLTGTGLGLFPISGGIAAIMFATTSIPMPGLTRSAFMLLGLACVTVGLGRTTRQRQLVGAGAVQVGLSCILIAPSNRSTIAFVAAGIATIALGFGFALSHRITIASAVLCMGIAIAGAGTSTVRTDMLLGAAQIALGLALIARGATNFARPETGDLIRLFWRRLTSDQAKEPLFDVVKQRDV